MNRILVTGACGQIGSELVVELRHRLGDDNVLATDIRTPEANSLAGRGPFEKLDCTDLEALRSLARAHNSDSVFHLAAMVG